MIKLSDVKAGDILFPDDGFDCLLSGEEAIVEAYADGELFVRCSRGTHALVGQLGDDGTLVGLTKKV